MRFIAPLLLACLWVLPAAAQRLIISGQVVEATNGEPVPFASIFIPNTSTGATADADGKFKLAVTGTPDSIAASALGFVTQRRKLTSEPVQAVLFRLKAGAGVALTEVVVRPGENPAFRILREVQKHKPDNARSGLQAAEYDSYNRIETSLIDLPASMSKRKVIQDIRALAVRQGAAAASDADAPLPIFASEVGSRVYQKTTPLRRREDLLHKQMRGVGPREARCSRKCWAPTSRISTSTPTGRT
ncbi:carboxypeptidase-like regulatory domain-containing protein [Hymenobacter humi]|uniref:Carboxypeptidase-like regulatory domain-containing protein n=1 Tax=Hymenobacter humi TaxID=1411620 RepID=A0ABW2U1I6_9BACT